MVVLVSCLREPRPENQQYRHPKAIRHESTSSHACSHRGKKVFFIESTDSNTSLGNHPQRCMQKYCFINLLSGYPLTQVLMEHLSLYSWTVNTPYQSSTLVSISELNNCCKIAQVHSLCEGLQ